MPCAFDTWCCTYYSLPCFNGTRCANIHSFNCDRCDHCFRRKTNSHPLTGALLFACLQCTNGGVEGPAPTLSPRLARCPHRSLSLSPRLFLSYFSLKSPLLSPPRAGPQWAIWWEYRGSTKYEHTYKYRESKTYDDPYQHVCTTPKVCTVRIICTLCVCMWYLVCMF